MALNGTTKNAVVAATVTATAAVVCAGRPTGGVVTFQNQSASDIYIGDSSVSTSAGYLLRAKSSTILDSFTDSISTDPWYAVVASGSVTLIVLSTY